MCRTSLGVVVLLTVASIGLADNPVTWMLDQTINRGDSSRFWTSPTAIDLGFAKYVYDYEITRVEAIVQPTFSSFAIDITNQIAASFPLTGEGIVAQLPAVLLEDSLSDPGSGTSADVRIEVDSSGYGQSAFTNIALGSASTFFGGPLPIQRVRVRATVSLRGVMAGDYNADDAVNTADFIAWTSAYGGAAPSLVDGSNDGVIDSADYTVWRDAIENAPAAVATPEPSAALLAGLFGGGGLALGRCRV